MGVLATGVESLPDGQTTRKEREGRRGTDNQLALWTSLAWGNESEGKGTHHHDWIFHAMKRQSLTALPAGCMHARSSNPHVHASFVAELVRSPAVYLATTIQRDKT